MLQPEDFFDLKESGPRALFQDVEFVWEVLGRLKTYLKETLSPNVNRLCGDMVTKTRVLWGGDVIEEGFVIEVGDASKGELKVFQDGAELKGASEVYAGAVLSDDRIQIGKGSVVEPGALIKGPTVICDHTEVRQGAYMRGNCLVGNGCVVGHTTEMKSSIMLEGAKAGHFAYIGDSILGNNVNLGAGTKLANLKIVDTEIRLRIEGRTYMTGLRKFGAILGDRVEMGCNSVSSPGTLLGRDSLVYPTVNVPGGYYPNSSVVSVRSKKILAVKSLKLK
jgi:carbonic anhydrase/acetyltransferase-like protein (isoleucine patch superfamily)